MRSGKSWSQGPRICPCADTRLRNARGSRYGLGRDVPLFLPAGSGSPARMAPSSISMIGATKAISSCVFSASIPAGTISVPAPASQGGKSQQGLRMHGRSDLRWPPVGSCQLPDLCAALRRRAGFDCAGPGVIDGMPRRVAASPPNRRGAPHGFVQRTICRTHEARL